MPTILPPKRRRIRGKKPEVKPESSVQQFKEESVTERLATEFKRHNWLEKKLATHDTIERKDVINADKNEGGDAIVAPQVKSESPNTPGNAQDNVKSQESTVNKNDGPSKAEERMDTTENEKPLAKGADVSKPQDGSDVTQNMADSKCC